MEGNFNAKKLGRELKKYNFILDKDRLDHLWNWFEWFYIEDRKQELISEIIASGKCVCGKSEWAINQDQEADFSKRHLSCLGCEKNCDEGATRGNSNHSFISEDCGAYVFQKWNGKRVEEWYCPKCKFELLCGDCGSPHELETEFSTRSEYEDFYICDGCEVERYDRQHEEQHRAEPDLECSRCESFVDNWNYKIEQVNKANL